PAAVDDGGAMRMARVADLVPISEGSTAREAIAGTAQRSGRRPRDPRRALLGREVEPPKELGIEGDDDGRGRHEDRADAHREDEPDGGEDARGERHGDQVVSGGPPEVLR